MKKTTPPEYVTLGNNNGMNYLSTAQDIFHQQYKKGPPNYYKWIYP